MTTKNRTRLVWSIAGLLAAALLVMAAVAVPIHSVQTEGTVIPTTRVAEGDVSVVVYTTGEFKPLKAQALVAPSVGGPMQILRIAATGTRFVDIALIAALAAIALQLVPLPANLRAAIAPASMAFDRAARITGAAVTAASARPISVVLDAPGSRGILASWITASVCRRA